MIEFSVFLGIDQTGAQIDRGKNAKPLKVCLARKSGKYWQVYTQYSKSKTLTLEALTPLNIETLLRQFNVDWPNPKVAVLADCVLGLPEEVSTFSKTLSPSYNLWKLFQKAVKHSYQEQLFGLKVSESFFSPFLKNSEKIPVRTCEKMSGSNSLFTTKPFQKNIQTGSYRIWRDLASTGSEPWLNIWPFNSEKDFERTQAWLFEGYPSLFWNKVFKIKNRNAEALIKQIKSPPLKDLFKFDTVSLIESDSDLCDATVLALGGILQQNQGRLLTPFPGFWDLKCLTTEGWIAGLTDT